MNLRERRVQIALASVAVVGGAAFFMRSGSNQAAVDRATPTETRARVQSPQAAVVDLNLERLRREHEELAPAERDLFRFKPKAPPPPPPRPAAPPAPAVVVAPPVPTGPPPPPPIQLKFIGLVDAPTQSGRVAVLSDARGNVFYGKEGDIIDGRFRVVKITTDSAELVYVDGQGRQILRLSGQ